MHLPTYIVTAFCTSILLLAGCGSGGNGANNTTQDQINFKSPVAGTTLTFARQITDNSNNTINLNFSRTINSINSDGSIASTVTGQQNSVIVNGTNYNIGTYNELLDSAGNLLSQTFTSSNPTIVKTYTPKQDIIPYPLYVGKIWNSAWSMSSTSGASSSFVLTGGVAIGSESVTVPAGTFNTIKVQYKTVDTPNPNGTITTLSRTSWWAIDTTHEVMSQNDYSYSGVMPVNGYAVRITDQLQSYQ